MRVLSRQLYYTGLTDSCSVSVNEASASTVQLKRDYSIELQMMLPAQSIHTVVITK